MEHKIDITLDGITLDCTTLDRKDHSECHSLDFSQI